MVEEEEERPGAASTSAKGARDTAQPPPHADEAAPGTGAGRRGAARSGVPKAWRLGTRDSSKLAMPGPHIPHP